MELSLTNGHLDGKLIELYVREELDKDQSSRIQAHAKVCSVCGERMVASFLARLEELKKSEPSKNRRMERRFESGEQGSLQVLCPLSFDRIKVQIADTSKNGLGLLLDSYLAAGTFVQVYMGTTISVGAVRSCQCAESKPGMFHAGILLKSTYALKAGESSDTATGYPDFSSIDGESIQ